MAEPEDVDSNALTYLVYLHDIVKKRLKANPSFDIEKIDVIVEIINPKNYDVVHNYSVTNVVISNRYVSKLLTQIGSKDALYEMYCDILSYDEEGAVSAERAYNAPCHGVRCRPQAALRLCPCT